jgi:hypothetical protein
MLFGDQVVVEDAVREGAWKHAHATLRVGWPALVDRPAVVIDGFHRVTSSAT